MKRALVKDWMTSPCVTAPADMTLPEAHKVMKDKRIRRLPIVGAKGQLLGIVTRGDIRGAEPSEATSLSIYELNYLLAKLTLEKIMHPDPVTVAPEMTIREAAKLMLTNKIAGLPVVEEGKLVGIITESDIFRVVVKSWDEM